MTQKVLFITSNVGVEHDELIQPLHFLQSKGIECIHAAIEASTVRTVKMDSESAASYPPDVDLDHVHYEDYDLLIIPGGAVNVDLLRHHPKALEIIQSFSNQAKPIAVISHAPWVLINAERIQAKQLTSHKNIRLDLENTGAIWVDQAVHKCNAGGWTLISSRSPEDLPAFNQAILKEIESNSSI